MSIAVYPRLDELLRERMLTVAELERRIKLRFGLTFDSKTLYRLARAEPIRRADLKIAGAAAAILGVELCDLFEVQASPVGQESDEGVAAPSPEKSQRLAELFDLQSRRALLANEQRELDALVAEYVRSVQELRIREYAAVHGISVEQARREMAARLDEALEWARDFEADPKRQREVLARGRARRARATR